MSESSQRWVRPPLTVRRSVVGRTAGRKIIGPDRRAGGFYRTAEGKGAKLKSVPLTTAEDSIVAAVRMAYKVAEAQIDRSDRLARRLRDAGDRAVGPGSERHALDATELLVFRAMMGGLTWLEGAAAERESPLKRILAVQYRMVGSMLGLGETESSPSATIPVRAPASSHGGQPEGARSQTPGPTRLSARALKIRHLGTDRRLVTIAAADFVAVTQPRTRLVFYNIDRINGETLGAELIMRGKGGTTLELGTPLAAPSGTWRAAICDKDGFQCGFIEMIL